MQPICAVCNRIIWTPAREFVREGDPDDWASMPARPCLDEGWRPKRVYVCAGTACQASGASDIIRVAKKYIIQEELHDRISLRITGCHGFCEMGPFILTEPQNAFYTQVSLENVPRIIDAVLKDEYVEELLYRDPVTDEVYRERDEIPFFKYQKRSILGTNQKIDPIRIYDYIAHHSPTYGKRMVDRITSRSEQIAEHPFSGRKVPEYENEDIRELIEDPYQ